MVLDDTRYGSVSEPEAHRGVIWANVSMTFTGTKLVLFCRHRHLWLRWPITGGLGELFFILLFPFGGEHCLEPSLLLAGLLTPAQTEHWGTAAEHSFALWPFWPQVKQQSLMSFPDGHSSPTGPGSKQRNSRVTRRCVLKLLMIKLS